MDAAYRSRFSLLLRIVTTRNKHSRWWMQSRFCRGNADARADVLIAYWAIEVTTRSQSGKACVLGTSCLCSPGATPSTEVDWADGGGWWNELLLG